MLKGLFCEGSRAEEGLIYSATEPSRGAPFGGLRTLQMAGSRVSRVCEELGLISTQS